MKKKGAIFVLMIFLISLIPISIAAEDDGQKRLDLEKDRLKVVANDQRKEKVGDLEDKPKPRLIAAKVSKEDLLKEKKFTDLKKERLDRLKSKPIIPLQPSVPNFILSNLSAVKFKISLISFNYLY